MRAGSFFALALTLALAGTTGCAPNRGGTPYAKSVAEARRASNAGHFDEAALRFDDAAKNAKLPRDQVFMRYEAALARARAGEVSRARQELLVIAQTKPANAYSAQAAFKAAELVADADAARANAELEAVMTDFPESGVAQVSLHRLLRKDDEEGPAKALEHLDRLAPQVTGKHLEESVLYERARRLEKLDRTENARDAYLACAAKFPYPFGAYNDDSLFRAAEMEEKLGHDKEAIAILERLLTQREKSSVMGSYERPRYVPALLRIVKIQEEKLHDRAKARESLHRLYSDFQTSPLRDDALWREAELWRKDGDASTSCSRLSTLTSDFPDSRYVPCAIEKCPSISRPAKSKAPKSCHAYLTRDPSAAAPAAGAAGE